MAVLEAMAVGLPVVSYRVGQVPELITDAVDGFAVDRGDVETAAACLAGLRRNPIAAREIGMRARAKIVAEYTEQALIPRLDAVYRRVASDARRH